MEKFYRVPYPYSYSCVSNWGNILTKNSTYATIKVVKGDNKPSVSVRDLRTKKSTRVYVDELVAMTLIEGYEPSVHEIEHIDGDPLNCKLENLVIKSK